MEEGHTSNKDLGLRSRHYEYFTWIVGDRVRRYSIPGEKIYPCTLAPTAPNTGYRTGTGQPQFTGYRWHRPVIKVVGRSSNTVWSVITMHIYRIAAIRNIHTGHKSYSLGACRVENV
jgi:hypothetical protein